MPRSTNASATAGLQPYAHLLGLPAAAAAPDPDKKDDQDRDADGKLKRLEGESDEDYKARVDADEKKEDEPAAEGEGDEGDEDDEGKEAKAARLAKEDELIQAARSAHGPALEIASRRAARAAVIRCKTIFSSRAAAGRVALAAHLAFDTRMTSREAIGTMAATPAAQAALKGSSLRDAMGREAAPRLGPGGAERPDPNSAMGLAAAVVAAGDKARGITRQS